ncbi:uncharacterized protein LOC116294563 [Actinia tenebrosa]|uniref:Uncharacterized protein LOC116294563 n=1 Tax=Actinia tenebrosa TaxID=6105 RepID=A0A6P8HNV3_ACTTE|nr:uncharacterized protein LOC116294563 [Actinia tenebrosa]
MASSAECNFTASFLQDIGLSQLYESRFLSQGFENFIDMVLIDGKDLDILDVTQEHKDKILKAVDDLSVDMVLKAYNLESHTKNFHKQNINTVKDLKNTKIEDSLLEKLDIKSAGHRKRLSICVQLLQANRNRETEISKPQEQLPSLSQATMPSWHPDAVAIGYWNRPSILPKLSHDFLCVKGYLKSGLEDSNESECLEFLVDSASDVVTAREEIIEKLGFNFLQHVESHGVHTIADKPLYSGYIRLGRSAWIKVEVQPEKYESVGSTVMKEFFHFINGNFHQWIPNFHSHITETPPIGRE